MFVIVIGAIILCTSGLLVGLGLAFASRLFAVRTDPRVAALEKILPGANCGLCGNASCYVYARRMVEEGVAGDLCVMSRSKTAEISMVLGREVHAAAPKVAALRCHGGLTANRQFVYAGLHSCRIAAQCWQGDTVCQYSCLGFGDCMRVCHFGAIALCESRGRPQVNPQKCTGCGRCVQECPRQVIVLIPADVRPHIACNSRDAGKTVRQYCAIGCISCGRCIKVCPQQAIVRADDHMSFIYERCTSCGLCISACPRGIIADGGRVGSQ